MLGNHADTFFTAPMRTRITQGGNLAGPSEMPMPRPANESAVGSALNKLASDFLPGLNIEVPAPAPVAPAPKPWLILGLSAPIVLGGLAAFLFLTPPGKRLRARVGL